MLVGHGGRPVQALSQLSLPPSGPFVFELNPRAELLPLRVRLVVQIIHGLFADSIGAFARSGSIASPIVPARWEPTFVAQMQSAGSVTIASGTNELCRLPTSLAPASWLAPLPPLIVELVEPPIALLQLCVQPHLIDGTGHLGGFLGGMASGLVLGLLIAWLRTSAQRTPTPGTGVLS